MLWRVPDVSRQNLTLQLDGDVIRRAKVIAAKRGTSVSALAAQQLLDLVADDERYEQARARAESLLAGSSARGWRTWSRDELHDRADPTTR